MPCRKNGNWNRELYFIGRLEPGGLNSFEMLPRFDVADEMFAIHEVGMVAAV